MRRTLPASIFISLAVVLAGCGGGTGGSGAISSGGQDSNFGPFQTRAQGGKPLVVTSSNGGPSITGVAGAAFTKITFAPTPNAANSRIAYVRGGPVPTLDITRNDGSNDQVVPSLWPSGASPSWSRDGRLAVGVYDPFTTTTSIWVVNSDGTNAHKISSGTGNQYSPSWSSDNFHIAYVQKDSAVTPAQIYNMTATGGTVTHVSDGSSSDDYPQWSPDGTKIYFRRYDSGLNLHTIWSMNANGSSRTAVAQAVNDAQTFAVSPLNNLIAVSDINGAPTISVILFSLPGGLLEGYIANTSGTQYTVTSWSPDGRLLLFEKNNGTATELDTMNSGGTDVKTAIFHADSSPSYVAFEPYPVPIPYVASTGGYILGTASSGFLYSLNGDALNSFLSFTATTPTTAVATADPVSPGASNIIYRLSADAITSIKFVNGLGGAVNAPTVGTGTKSAIVSFNGTTGFVSSVVTVASKASAVASKRGDETVLSGAFTGAFDVHGKNLAPGGAQVVVLGKGGEVMTAR